jgi:hypothetical protein
MFSYRQILKTALRISWKNKYLWLFGVFASFLSIGAEYQILWRSMSQKAALQWYANWGSFMGTGIFSWRAVVNFVHLYKSSPGAMFALTFLFLLVLAILAAIIWLAVVSEIALVGQSEKIIKSKKDKAEMAVSEGFQSGKRDFWPVFGLNVFGKILINVIIILVTIPILFSAANRLAVNVVYTIFFIILIPIAIGASLMIKYAIAFVVLKKQKLFVSLNSAWELFQTNWIISIEMALLLFLISFVATLLILFASLILAVPFLILATSFFFLFSPVAFSIVLVLGVITLIVFFIVAGSFLTSYQVVAWTNLFMQLATKGGESKLERILPENMKHIDANSINMA